MGWGKDTHTHNTDTYREVVEHVDPHVPVLVDGRQLNGQQNGLPAVTAAKERDRNHGGRVRGNVVGGLEARHEDAHPLLNALAEHTVRSLWVGGRVSKWKLCVVVWV